MSIWVKVNLHLMTFLWKNSKGSCEKLSFVLIFPESGWMHEDPRFVLLMAFRKQKINEISYISEGEYIKYAQVIHLPWVISQSNTGISLRSSSASIVQAAPSLRMRNLWSFPFAILSLLKNSFSIREILRKGYAYSLMNFIFARCEVVQKPKGEICFRYFWITPLR